MPEVIYNQNKLKETEDRITKLEEQRSKIKEQKEVVEKQQAKVNEPELREQLEKEKTKFDQDDASLLIEAERLNKEALEMQKKADTYKDEIFKLNRYLVDNMENPERSISIYKEISSKK